jgi:hypothetical protein
MNSEPGIQRLQASRRRETRSLFSRQHGSRSRELCAAGNKAAPRNSENADGELEPVRLTAIAIAAAKSRAHAQAARPESLERAAIHEPDVSARAYASSGLRERMTDTLAMPSSLPAANRPWPARIRHRRLVLA